ncbi:MAG: hypothetical protein WCL07_04165 [bacterium]
MSEKEVWGLSRREFQNEKGNYELAWGIFLLTASAVLVSSGAGCLGAVPAVFIGIGSINKGIKDKVSARFGNQ